jgi:hypothetical protein
MAMVFSQSQAHYSQVFRIRPLPWRERLSKADNLGLKIRKVLPHRIFGALGKGEFLGPTQIPQEFKDDERVSIQVSF